MQLIKDDDFDNYFLQNFSWIINSKTILLPVAIILPSLNFLLIFRNDFYLFISTFISLLLITWNFPYISKFSYLKPIYYDDLISDDINLTKSDKKIIYNIEISKKFKNKFLILQQFLLSITVALLIDYISFKYKEKQYLTSEFVGVLGGILSLYAKIIKALGKVILICLYRMKKKEKEALLIKLNINNKYNEEINNYYNIEDRKEEINV